MDNYVSSDFEFIFMMMALIIFVSIFMYHIIKVISESVEAKREEIVKKYSKRYQLLLLLNKKYKEKFRTEINERYCYNTFLSSKQQYDRFNYDDFFEEVICENKEMFVKIVEDTKYNQQYIVSYEQDFLEISLTEEKKEIESSKIKYYIFERVEEQLLATGRLYPVTNPLFMCRASYTSPKGRNHYSNTKTYSFSELLYHYDKAIRKIYIKQTKEYQRQIMTDSLRYDILKRDNFRCVLCGRSAQDGVKLHVDHIIPVSKGGKTERNNLRTLCEKCNYGKRDKYDEYGVN